MTETPTPFELNADTLTSNVPPLRKAVVALGSNLGDRLANLQGALAALEDTPDVSVIKVSSIYETEPVDAPAGSPNFLNAVVLIDTTLRARTLLTRVLAIEDAFLRERDPGVQNSPRTLDIDLIVVGNRLSDDAELTLPHPRAHQRAFVLLPWAEIEPEAEIPGKGRIKDIIAELDASGVVPRPDFSLIL